MAPAWALPLRASEDWRSVDAEAFYRAKQAMDEASVPLHEAAIARSLKGMPSTPSAPASRNDS